MVSSEAAPFAKTGGLADVLGALPQALARQGDEVMVVLPGYGSTNLSGAERIYHEMNIWMENAQYVCALDRIVSGGIPYLFVRHLGLFDRPGLYGDRYGDFGDNHLRFAVLCRVALGIASRIWRPDIIHAHDWQGSLVPVYLRSVYRYDPTFSSIRTVLTIHNLGYQGRFALGKISDLGLNPAEVMHAGGLEYYGDLNYLKGGILYSDFLTTVSPRYAQEIQTPEYGFGLDGLLRSRHHVLQGILNGVDYGEWNPEHDRHLPATFSAADLSGKRTCKKALLDEFGLPSDDLDAPLLGIVSRFAYQKGLDLVAECIQGLADLGVRMVVLGNGDPQLEETFGYFSRVRPQQFGYRGEYNNGLAHRIEAGADMFLMPSRYEPCGLNQIYSLRYGTIPIVRATGGLDDTIQHETGFKFWGATAHELYNCVAHAVDVFRTNPDWWRQMMLTGMSRDYSWDASARQYSQLYHRLAG
jgi:starch synthase